MTCAGVWRGEGTGGKDVAVEGEEVEEVEVEEVPTAPSNWGRWPWWVLGLS